MRKPTLILLAALSTSLLSCGSTDHSGETLSAHGESDITRSMLSNEAFLDKRAELIAKYSLHDKTFSVLQAQVDPGDSESENHWRWRIDQYLYGQSTEFQLLYNAYTKGKSFHQIYDLHEEDLSSKKAANSNMPILPSGYFTKNLPGNPHHGWADVNGNKITVVYQGELTDPYVASYDMASHTWAGPYKAAESTLSKGTRKIDSHGRPILEQDAQGYFHIVYGGHGGEREDGLNPLSIDTPHAGGRMLHAVSTKPNDISQFQLKHDITPFASYTKSHKMANGDIYLFTRAGTHKSPWLMYKMSSGSQTFEPPVVITRPEPQESDPIQVDTHYINPIKVSNTEIAISYLWHTCNFHEVHDKTNYGRHNAYYMKLDTTTGDFYNAYGEKLSPPITIQDSHEKTLAYDSIKAQETSFGTKPIKTVDGTPAVAYEARGPGYREWRMTKLVNGEWQHGLPMPGTSGRTLFGLKHKPVAKVVAMEAFETGGTKTNNGLAIYKNREGKTVLSTVSCSRCDRNEWQVDKEYLSLSKARMTMELVKRDNGDTVAAIVNVKKGGAQRLYLWHDAAIRPL